MNRYSLLSIVLVACLLFSTNAESQVKVPNPPNLEDKETHCLAKAIYFETYQAKTELSRRAVAWVVYNRQHTDGFPHTICGVIHAKGQFPWTRERIKNQEEYQKALEVARKFTDRLEWNDPTNGALYFASRTDGWFNAMIYRGFLVKTHYIEGHWFYQYKDKKAYYE